MRKHFLLLFLMAILPLAGWAEAPTVTGTPVAPQLQFTNQEQSLVPSGLTASAGASLYYAVTETSVLAAPGWSTDTYKEAGSVAKKTVPGTYRVWYLAHSTDGTSEAAYVDVTIAPADLSSGWTIAFSMASAPYNGAIQKPTITLTKSAVTLPATAFVATWNQDPRNKGEYTVSIAANGTHTVNAPSNFTKKFTITPATINLAMTVPSPASVEYGTAHPAWASTVSGFIGEEQTALWDATKLYYEVKKGLETFTQDVLPAGNYTITPKYNGTFDNYTVVSTTANFEVTAKALTGLTVTGLDNVIYNGDVQKAANVVVKKGDDVIPADQYEVKYFASEDHRTAGTPEATVKNVATYYVSIKSKEGANYSFTINDKTYKIDKAPLIVVANDCSKTYDGTAVVPSTITYSYLGLQNLDVASDQVTEPTTKSDGCKAVASANASTTPYAIETDPTKFTSANYEFLKSTDGRLTINKKNLTITFKAATTTITYEKEYKDANPDFNASDVVFNPTTGAVVTEPTTFTWKDAHLDFTGAVGGDLNKVTGIKYNLTVARATTDENVGKKVNDLVLSKNDAAVFNNYNVNINAKHDFEITPARIYVSIKDQTKQYDGQVASIAQVTDEMLIVSNLKGDDTKAVLTTKPTATIVAADKAVKTYTVTLSNAVAANYVISYLNSRYIIEQKELTWTIPAQTLQQGEAITHLNKAGFTVTGLVGSDVDAKNDIWELKVKDALCNTTPGFINADAVTTADGIELVVKTGDAATAAAANYKFKNIISPAMPTGQLVIPAATAVVLNDTESIDNLTPTASASSDVVTFTNRQFKKGVWETLVLPFATSVRKVSQALGYAVVDMLQESGDDMNFKIYMGEIPAFTPFLVKTDADVNLNTVEFKKLTGETANIQIVKLSAANRDNLTKSNNSYNFIGQVKYEEITAAQWWSKGPKMTETHFEFDQYESGQKCKAMRAYITAKEGVTAAPNIFVEEPDGSTTAITCISADGRLVEADGWHTLNGVKLQGAPTEKGVYIKNGKKVVIK